MTSISSWEWPTARAWRPAVTLATLALPMVPDIWLRRGCPLTGSHLPVALWFIGAVILGLALAYGIMRNRRRTIAEKRVTDPATKSLYVEEERDRVKSRRGF
jgi:hypothetical protein